MKKMLSTRIKAAMTHGKLNQSELAARVGVTKGAVSQWLNGTTAALKSETSIAIAEVTGVNHSWLVHGRGTMTPAQHTVEEPRAAYRVKPLANEVTISQYATGGSMGKGLVLNDASGAIRSWTVDIEWVKNNVKNHTGVANLCIVTGFGDSMRPTFNAGDPLLVDRGITTCEHDAIYFFRVGNEGFIKRLQRIPTAGGVLIRAKSKNADYDSFDITETMDFQVLGKVLTVWKSEQF